ncbi:AMP-binding protein [Actinomadura sp. DC4]|uniref:AMP-binding protein n=1 Tax=Actinomadura sp. DC4 TaxID=3055069 RepID=UPI0025B0AFA3|nr:AMP-binding protein [Actinomadura sp. DC4]MDN3359379.1 AMP-binding protein [Actinomadura sp. DC4]
MGEDRLTDRPVVSRLRDARDNAGWVPDPGYSMVRDALFDQDPERVAILSEGPHGPEGVTFGEIQRTVRRIAGALRDRGVRPGDRVAMYLEPSQVAAEVVCGVLTAGAVILPIPRLLGGLSVTHRLRDAGASILVTDSAGSSRLQETDAATTGVTVLTVDSTSRDDLLDEAGRAEPVDPYRPSAGEPALLMYTSGTSGNPKGIVHANRVLLGHAGVDFAFELFEESDVYYGTADWGWVGGLMLGLLVPWSFGVPVVAFRQRRFDPAVTLDVLGRYGVTIAFLPPSVLRVLAAHGRRPRRRLRAVVTGGEPAGAAEMTWARRHLSAAVNKAFGQTEANALIGDSAVLASVDDATMGAPYPGHGIVLLDEAGAEVASGEVGEIALTLPDPVAMLGVWDAALGRPVAAGRRVHRTGDLARRACGRRLEYLGRADDVIKSRGYRIGPGEIEQALKLHPSVDDAAAVGVPDADIGQHVKAFVQLRETELDDALEAALRELVASTVGPHARPREIEAIDRLPRTETGKLLRGVLSAKPKSQFSTGKGSE